MFTQETIVIVLSNVFLAIVLIFLSIALTRFVERIDVSYFLNQRLVERRLKVYDKVMPKLNDLLCYYTYVGNWKELSPSQIIAFKRKLDKRMYIARPLFSKDFFQSYLDFMELCFKTFAGEGEDAKLRTKTGKRCKLIERDWLPEYDEMFVALEDCSDRKAIQKAYDDMVFCFSVELGLEKKIKPKRVF